jgi:hypothetical protein
VPDDVGGQPLPGGEEPEYHHPGAADEEFAALVLDEDFVRSATIHEPTAVERILAAAQSHAESEPARGFDDVPGLRSGAKDDPSPGEEGQGEADGPEGAGTLDDLYEPYDPVGSDGSDRYDGSNGSDSDGSDDSDDDEGRFDASDYTQYTQYPEPPGGEPYDPYEAYDPYDPYGHGTYGQGSFDTYESYGPYRFDSLGSADGGSHLPPVYGRYNQYGRFADYDPADHYAQYEQYIRFGINRRYDPRLDLGEEHGADFRRPHGRHSAAARRRPYRGHDRWQRPVAWLLALLMGIGVVALALSAIYRGTAQHRQDPSRPPATSDVDAPGAADHSLQGIPEGIPGGPEPSP